MQYRSGAAQSKRIGPEKEIPDETYHFSHLLSDSLLLARAGTERTRRQGRCHDGSRLLQHGRANRHDGSPLGTNGGRPGFKPRCQDLCPNAGDDHTADYQQLGILAAKAGLTVPTGLDAPHNKMIAPFEKLKGAAFDSRYIQTMIAGHTEAIGVYTKESSDAQSADVKAYASATLPTLQKHLDGAKSLPKKPAK